MGINYLWDTNTVIYFLQNQFPPHAERFIEEVIVNSTPAFSVITEIELLCWKTEEEEDLRILQEFINAATVFDLTTPVKLKTVAIRKSTRIKLPDALIAATAIVHELTLITRNTRDFRNLTELQVVNPFEVIS